MNKLIPLFLVVALFACALGGCAAPEADPGISDVKTSDDAEIGASIEADDWHVMLIEPPQLMKRVMEDEWRVRGVDSPEQTFPPGSEIAEGVWLVCPVQLTNNGELRMLPSKLLRVTDEQGREFPMTDMAAHYLRIWSTERWMNNDNQLIQNPMDVDVTREGPIIFDVAEDSIGLRLTADGIEGSIDLGF